MQSPHRTRVLICAENRNAVLMRITTGIAAQTQQLADNTMEVE
jgi:hypothetical protein